MYSQVALASPVRDADLSLIMRSRLWRWRVTIRVAADITAFIVVLVLVVFSFLVLKRIEPVRMGFYCDDTSIRYPYKEDTVPDWSLFIAVFAIPLFTLVVGGLYEHLVLKRESEGSLRCGRVRFPLWPLRIFHWICVVLVALGVTEIITGVGKQMGGRLRPHFLAVCNPDFSTINCTDEYGFPRYVTEYECTGDPKDVIEARLSWPSGHASSAACSLTFTALYLLSLPILYRRSLIQITAVAFCLFAAIICGLTRVTDFHHHTFDVICGLIIGSSVAFATAYYHLYLFGHLQSSTREVTNELRRGSVMSHVLYRRTTLTGEEDSRVCEEVHVEETDRGGGGKEGVKKAANEEAWKGVPV